MKAACPQPAGQNPGSGAGARCIEHNPQAGPRSGLLGGGHGARLPREAGVATARRVAVTERRRRVTDHAKECKCTTAL